MKVGVLGGAFNPPHIGHLILAEAAIERLNLDKVLFIPTHYPPHKGGANKMETSIRSLMIKMAACTIRPNQLRNIVKEKGYFNADEFNGLDKFINIYKEDYKFHHDARLEVSDIEWREEELRGNKSYTINSIKFLSRKHKRWEIELIIGLDQAQAINTWKDLDELKKIAKFRVAKRGAQNIEKIIETHPFLTTFEFAGVEVSSTLIRENIKNNRNVSALVPPIINEFLKIDLILEKYLT